MSDFTGLIAAAEQRAAQAGTQRAGLVAEQDGLIAGLKGGSFTEDQQARFDAISAEKATLQATIDSETARAASLRKEQEEDDKATRAAVEQKPAAERQAAAVVTKEERTYNKGNKFERSFFHDMYASEFMGDYQARERVARHQTEARVEGELSERAGTTTGFAGLVPPVYLVEDYALVARAGRPIADSVHHEQLPDSGMSIIIPRGTTGVSAAIQATENSATSNTDEVWSNVTVPVVTIAGQQVVSRQSLERGVGIDGIIFKDLWAAYNVALDSQVISGTGSSGQMLGILNTASINQASAFGAAATIPTFYSKTAGQLSAVETTRYLAPDVIYMHPRRWNWLLSQVDSSNRPYVVPNMNGPYNAVGVAQSPIDTPSAAPVGWIFGVPVVTDASIPTNLGTGALEDVEIVAHKEDLILWENGDGAPFQLRFEQTAGASLSTTLVAYNYAAFTAGRFPSAVGLVGGNAGTSGFGLTTVTF